MVKLKADAQQVVSIIKGDKAKNQTYCQILNLGDELDEFGEQKDRKKAEDQSQTINELENNAWSRTYESTLARGPRNRFNHW